MAQKILRDDIEEIPDVNTWAKKLGISTRWLSKIMKEEYGASPKKLLRMRRYESIRDCIDRDLEMTGFCIAIESGLKDEHALYKFLSTHYNTGLKKLRREIWAEKLGEEAAIYLPNTDIE
tara:strand:+ start:389 stop:748 length:360 start_codon:yes stop_codon:yes gene_type:complete